MSLIKSISGIRGTIGGRVGDNLTPVDAVKYAAAYGVWLKIQNPNLDLTVIIGRDARISGKLISDLVSNTLMGLGINVKDLGLSTTPTVEIAVPMEKAHGGVVITASHNPKEWNALKLLNSKGEFLNSIDGENILKIADNGCFEFAEIDSLGSYCTVDGYVEKHIEEVLKLKVVDVNAIKKAKFKVVLDAVNSTGGIAIPKLLEKLGVECIKLYCDPNGYFPHNPEPLKEHLIELSRAVINENADLGIVVDPDVDRLALICEDGSMFGEEYTLVACADYILGQNAGGYTVSNLSSSQALRDITNLHKGVYTASAVGEVNVVLEMKRTKAIIGGEGNGGIIYPELHYGRDALVGVALFLSHLAKKGLSCKDLRLLYPKYFMSKTKIELYPTINVDMILEKLAKIYEGNDINTIDGLKIDFGKEWIHLRKSNTEPIIRIYGESFCDKRLSRLIARITSEVNSIV